MFVFLGLGDAKVLSFALGDAKVPDARYFAFWWNIGLRIPKSSKETHKNTMGLTLFNGTKPPESNLLEATQHEVVYMWHNILVVFRPPHTISVPCH